LKTSIEQTEESANVLSLQALPRSELQAKIVAYLFTEKKPVTLNLISMAMGINEDAVGRAINKLVKRDIILSLETSDGAKYQLNTF